MVRIARNGKRAEIDKNLFILNTKYPTNKELNALFRRVSLLQRPDPMRIVTPVTADLRRFDCVIYVFERCNQFPLIPDDTSQDYDSFYRNPRPYLLGVYTEVHDLDARAGDVAVYMPRDLTQNAHFGIYIGDGKIRSKWGWSSPVLEHNIDFVPELSMGDEIVFFRRIPRGEIQ